MKATVSLAGAVQDALARLLRQIAATASPGRTSKCLRERFQRLRVIGRGVAVRAQGAIAPSRRVSASVGHDQLRVECSSVPRPSQSGQAPNGLLNENSRGSISSMVKPETGQANLRRERAMRLGLRLVRLACRRRHFGDQRRSRRRASARSRSSRRAARAMSARTTMRSTTTSMSCLIFLSSAGASSIS